MLRSLFLILFSVWLVACSAHDEQYYSTHPQDLQRALNNCPKDSPKQVSCRTLEMIANRINKYALELRTSPQGFGQEILALQEKIAQQEKALSQTRDQPDLKHALQENKIELEQRLAVVRWLESPEG
ncbi:hypothetical protein [Legionella yabuuchiae]|uniref:hypothetical protein n=1 Tax=Legionella yabuuchiae TaxID=376727 RepID=UPI0010559776|nr:hypothetical protein [Legionella yabuuchiae]